MNTKKLIRAALAMIIAVMYFTMTFASASAMTSAQQTKDDKTSYPGLDKKIVLEDGTLDVIASINAGDVVDFRLISNVPQDLTNFLKPDDVNDPIHGRREIGANPINEGKYELAFHDVMAAELAFNNDIVVKVNGKELPTELYTINVPTDGCTFEVQMDLVAIYEAVDANNEPYFTEADFGIAPITVDYSATSANDLVAGAYTNEAWVTYDVAATTAAGLGTSEHVVVTVYTCAVDIFKFDQADNAPLAGAEFILGTALNEDGTIVTEGAITGVSDEAGSLVFGGLKAGTYYLQETAAPVGYVCNDTVQTIVLNADLVNYTYTIDFANVEIPHTGGTGTILFTVGGAAVIALAVVAFVITRRKNSSVEE